MASSNGEPTPKIGILTKTIVRSPVVHWIVPAKIRHRTRNDVVFVGDDFIDVREVKKGGRLHDVFSYASFGSRICAAKALSLEVDTPEVDALFETLSSETLPLDALPSHLLVLTLESQAMLFIFLRETTEGTLEMQTQPVPLPRYPDARCQLSTFLAVDPKSRALAVSSMEDHLILWSVKPPAETLAQIRDRVVEWCPLKKEQPVAVNGVIQHITFLHPIQSDPDHVIFLTVIVENRRTRLTWYDWWYTGRIEQLQSHDTLSIDSPRSIPTLVIPLSRANFILIFGRTIILITSLLSGSVTPKPIAHLDNEYTPAIQGLSPQWPLWVNWCRPMRVATRSADAIYLAREDGQIFLLDVTDSMVTASYAGDLECHVGSAFASLGNDLDPDLFAVGGEMSTGRVASIGGWGATPTQHLERAEALGMDLVALIPSWASVTDVAIVSAPKQTTKSPQQIYVTGGKQPHGTISELRRGREAQVIMEVSMQDFRGVSAFWTLLHPPNGDVLFLFSTPESSIILCWSSEEDTLEAIDEATAFRTTEPTIAADVTTSGYLVQITSKAVVVTANLRPGFDENNEKTCSDTSILCAVIEPGPGHVYCAEAQDSDYFIVAYFLDDREEVGDFLAKTRSLPSSRRVKCNDQPLAIASIPTTKGTVIAVIEQAGLCRVLCQTKRELTELRTFTIPQAPDDRCESAVLLVQRGSADLKLICGFRSGAVYHCAIHLKSPVPIGGGQMVNMGQTPAKIVRHSSQISQAMAFCGSLSCSLTVDPNNVHALDISNIWLTDKDRPDMSQGAVNGFSRMPLQHDLANGGNLGMLAGHLVMLSDGNLSFVELAKVVTTVPRQIAVSGTPFRLVHSQASKCWVTAAAFCELRTINGTIHRQATDYIEFISIKKITNRKCFRLQADERAWCLLEWTHRASADKLHAFILVGCSSGEGQGKIYFLNPHMRHEDTEVLSPYFMSFRGPVHSIAIYDSSTFVACYGAGPSSDAGISLHRFDIDTRKWRKLCEAPLHRPVTGVAVTCAAPHIHLTTNREGLVTFDVLEGEADAERPVFSLKPVGACPRAAQGVAHTVLDRDRGDLAIMTTKDRQVIGLRSRWPPQQDHPSSLRIVFESDTKQALIRVPQGQFRPSWKSPLPRGVLAEGMVGICTDGSVIGLLAIDERLWRRLFWLQRLYEWSNLGLGERSLYTTGDADVLGESTDLPVGLSGECGDIALRSGYPRGHQQRNMQIDGDVLTEVLRSSADGLQQMITKVSERDDDIGGWVREHLEGERAAVESCLTDLKVLLDAWL